MKKLRKGTALTTTILVIFVCILIGSAVLNLVVYNYQLRTLDLKIKKVEYKNEIMMDKLYEITQSSIIASIGMAKKYAINAVDKAVEEEIYNYQRLEDERRRLSLEWQNNLGDIIFDSGEAYQEEMNNYVEENLGDEFKSMVFNLTDAGVQNQFKIQAAYNHVFQELYKYSLDRDYDIAIDEAISANLSLAEINSLNTLEENIRNVSNYADVVPNPSQNIFLSNKTGFNNKIKQASLTECVYMDNSLRFGTVNQCFVLSNEIWYKVKGTPTATVSADFVIAVPNFNDVASLEQKVVEFNNPLVGNAALIAGGQIKFNSGSTTNIYGNAIALGTSPLTAGVTLTSATANVEGKLITPNNIDLTTSTLSTSTVYYQNMFLKGTTQSNVNFNGDVYAKDDLEIETSKFTINQSTGNYYGFNDVNGSGPDESSSIIINANSIDTSSTITLNNLYLAGRAFIDKVLNVDNPSEMYKTGESIGVKGNYVVYQNPILDESSNYYINRVNYASYLYNNSVPWNLVNTFAGETLNTQIADFDVNHKWRYFVEAARNSIGSIRIPKITINTIKYMQGAGVGRIGSSGSFGVIDAQLFGNSDDPAFRTNCANEFELQTKYFGCGYNKKEYIFGANGWLNTITTAYTTSTQPIYISNSSITLSAAQLANYKVVIASGDITINAGTSGNFYGLMIAGGNININGTLNVHSSKNEIINMILTGAQDTTSTPERKLYTLFKDDGSGTRYVITVVGDGYIDIGGILGITNWNKKDWGYL
ncbi:MAG: hypothetical protein IJS47_01665 [Clostridia bacterium]|nr:hypothetical protein [Clostridia bacterium]